LKPENLTNTAILDCGPAAFIPTCHNLEMVLVVTDMLKGPHEEVPWAAFSLQAPVDEYLSICPENPKIFKYCLFVEGC
jgi:hypothetical protein